VVLGEGEEVFAGGQDGLGGSDHRDKCNWGVWSRVGPRFVGSHP
jgi:hypothetical protein